MVLEYDEWGPEKVLSVYDPKTGMKGFAVIDNTALGPGKGGIRMTPDVTVQEVARLARAMTWKCSIAELPFGGAKSGIAANSKELSGERKEEIVRAFSGALRCVCPAEYVAAPDMYMEEQEMEWFATENGSSRACTGKPASMGGLPHELGSTGFGVFHATKVAADHIGLELNGARFAVEGFGNVGWFASKFLTEHGAKLVAVSDSKGCIYNPKGIDFNELDKVKKETGSVVNYVGCRAGCCGSLLDANADILITAARPDFIREGDISRLKFRLIVEGSNIPMTHYVEGLCHRKGILVVPDFVANAGGVISSYVEYIGGSEKEMFKLIEKRIVHNTGLVLKCARDRDYVPRQWAMELAQERIRKAQEKKRKK